MNAETDVIEVCDLLKEQKELLWNIHYAATDPPCKVMAKADLANFLLCHGLHIHEMAKAALLLMQNREPYSVVLLARSALESAFNLVAAKNDLQFGPQRMAHEMEELAGKLTFLINNQGWPASRHPTPDECRQQADRIRKLYNAAALQEKGQRDRITKIERIAEVADLKPYYDDDYRQLSLTVHGNQAGIVNAGSGFLVRKGMIALCNAVLLPGATLCDVFRLRPGFDTHLQDQHRRLEEFMQRPDFIPQRKEAPSE